MQNLIVNSTARGLSQILPGGISKGFNLLAQPRCGISSDMKKQPTYARVNNPPMLLPGGGLGKLQGRFKEEQYFNANDHMLLAHIQHPGFRLKCEKSASNWAEFERMANACSSTVAIRKNNELSQSKHYTEESFFLQEQKSLLDRILEVLKRLAQSRRGDPPLSHGGPYGSFYPYGPHHYQSHPMKEQNAKTQNEEKVEEESEEAKKSEDTIEASSEKSENEEQTDGNISSDPYEETNRNNENDMDNRHGNGDDNDRQ